MNTRFIETFVLLARIGSVRRVAQHQHATPGAISMRMRALEEELGVPLFTWDRKTLQLTADGSRILRHAEHLMESTKALRAAAKAGDQSGGRIRVGVIESVVHAFLPQFMKTMAANLPNVEVDLTVDLTVNLADHFLRGDLDLVLRVGSDESSPFVVTEDVLELPIHWIAKRGTMPVRGALPAVLHGQLLTFMRGSMPNAAAVHLVRQLANQHGIPAGELRISGSPSLAALVSLVREGVGTAIMPGLFVKEQIEQRTLVELALPSPPPYRVSTWYQKDAATVVKETAEVVRNVARAYCRRTGDHWVHFAG